MVEVLERTPGNPSGQHAWARDARRRMDDARDAVAAAAWVDLAEAAARADLVTISGHKVGGPKGIGVLGVRSGVPITPLVLGGGQERERRSGTQNVAGAVALGVALAVTARERF